MLGGKRRIKIEKCQIKREKHQINLESLTGQLLSPFSTRRLFSREATFSFVGIAFADVISDADKGKSRFARKKSRSGKRALRRFFRVRATSCAHLELDGARFFSLAHIRSTLFLSGSYQEHAFFSLAHISSVIVILVSFFK